MFYDTTPTNPISFSSAFYEKLPEGGSLKDIFRAYGIICFRNGFVAGFTAGAAAVTAIVLATSLRKL